MAEIDLTNMTRAELTELRSQLDKTIASVGERDRQRAIKAAEDIAREHGFTLTDLAPLAGKGRSAGKRGSRSGAAPSPAPSDAKYRNPQNPEQTWSGRGRRPAWVHAALDGGRALEDLTIG